MEWLANREASYDELYNHRDIPRDLITAAKEFSGDVKVRWVPVEPEEEGYVPIVGRSIKRARQQVMINKKARNEMKKDFPDTVDEALAAYLRLCLDVVRSGRKKMGAAVRSGGMPSPASIATVAIDMLKERFWSYRPPGPMLITLLAALLQVNRRKLQASRNFIGRLIKGRHGYCCRTEPRSGSARETHRSQQRYNFNLDDQGFQI